MIPRSTVILCGTLNFLALFAADSSAEPPIGGVSPGALAEQTGLQQLIPLPVRVVDQAGKPVAGAKITPWALGSSQGHGIWSQRDDQSGIPPMVAQSDEAGQVLVLYPLFRDAREQTRTNRVTIKVDHPGFAFVTDLHINVPLESGSPHVVQLSTGAPAEFRPLIDGEPIGLESVFALWSDGRTCEPGFAPEKLPSGILRFSTLPLGQNSILLVKLHGSRVTHFSPIIDFNHMSSEPKVLDVPLKPALQLGGNLSDDVPRPVTGGRVKLDTLSPSLNYDRVHWLTWVSVKPDGTFEVNGWPAGEPMQLIALCDGFIASNGLAPDVVKNRPDPEKDGFGRPQVFDVRDGESIEVKMVPLARCEVTAMDEDAKPVAGLTVRSWPNVQWWNWGSQLYGYPLVRGERLLRERDYLAAVDETFPQPFQAQTDANGKAILELPVGKQGLVVMSDVYQLPVFLGMRRTRVQLVTGKTTEVTLYLQAALTDKLGEWDKLAGVVFGCSTREGRRICALPGVTKKMDEFAKRFREGANQQDPQLLAEAYTVVAEAFAGVGDLAEAAKWQQKAAEQAAKVQSAK